MDNKQRNESLELSAQELEDIAGGIAEYQPSQPNVEYPATGDLYNEVVKQVTNKLSDFYGGDYHYYEKKEYEVRSTDSAS